LVFQIFFKYCVGELSYPKPKQAHYRILGLVGLPALNEPGSTSLEFKKPLSKGNWA
jgi:hypothetical protein